MSRVHVLTFGAFDPLHPGHLWLFEQARLLGDHLIVVVARDGVIRATKHREPYLKQDQRLEAIQQTPIVDEAIMGEEEPGSYELLRQLSFDVLVVGYDQQPSDHNIRSLLSSLKKPHVRVIRLPAYRPQEFKSSFMRKSSSSA
ncbi:MAG: adenylyltransferase/cytidyltransferase family protein [Candidatus Andersenbacteria bacterium]